MGKIWLGLLILFLFHSIVIGMSDVNCNYFLRNPNKKNYSKCRETISAALKNRKNIPIISDDVEFKDFLVLLNKKKEYAVKLGFVLYKISDGAMAEELAVNLGKVINYNPRLILQLFIDENLSDEDMRAILLNYGDEYVDDLEKQQEETLKRIKNIESVKDKKINNIAKKCILLLKEQKEQIENIKKMKEIDKKNN